MKRYNIAQHAKKGAQKRWSTNFHLPMVKKARKERLSSAKAVIVILASNKDGLHFPHQCTWYEWAVNAKEVSFVVYAEDHVTFERECSPDQWTFWRPLLCPLQSSSAWGQFSLVYSELLALKWAREQSLDGEWFYVVSGDSVPTKSTEVFAQGPSGRSSVLGFTDREPSRLSNGCGLYEHSQWKVLSRVDVDRLVDGLVLSHGTLKLWKTCVLEEKRKLCCISVPDEWLVGSFLVAQEGNVDGHEDECIMKQIFIEDCRKCCHKRVGHARVLKRSEFRRLYKVACDDPVVFAIRKVDAREKIPTKNV
jgi:hypothetical protein